MNIDRTNPEQPSRLDAVKKVFVVGPSRSGTSLLSNILGMNSQIIGMHELHVFNGLYGGPPSTLPGNRGEATSILARLRARQLRTIWQDTPTADDLSFADKCVDLCGQDYSQIGVYRAFCMAIASESGRSFVVEQTPINVMYMREILSLFPEAKMIAMVRDPRAILNSQRSRWKMRFLGAPNVPLSETLRVLVNYHALTMSKLWVKAVDATEPYGSHPRVRIVRYEDLVSRPESVLAELCEFLGVEFEATMMSVGQIGSSTQRNDDRSAGVSKKSVDAWQKGLPKGDREICEFIAGRAARRYGYALGEGQLFNFSVLLHMLRFPFHLAGTLLTNPRRVLVMLNAMAFKNKANHQPQ